MSNRQGLSSPKAAGRFEVRGLPESPQARRNMWSPQPTTRIFVNSDSMRRTEDFSVPVAYHSVSAEVQHEIDRMSNLDYQVEQQRRNSIGTDMPPLKEDEKAAFDLINQLSWHSRQYKEFRRQTSTPEAEGRPQLPSPLPTPKRPIVTKVADHVRRISRAEVPKIDFAKEAATDDHLVALDVLVKRYGTSMTQGLNEDQVEELRLKFGRNILSPPKTTPAWLAFIKCLVGGFGIVLWVAFVMCILAYKPLGEPNPDFYNVILAFVIFGVILAQALFFFMQERRSSKLMASFANFLPPHCLVLRDGQEKDIEAASLVVGDVVKIKAGDKVPADIRLFQVNQAKVEKSGLTGESEPIPLSVTSADPNMYETKNLALFGTLVLEGTATGIVINTGDRTIMGKIAKIASHTSAVSTSLQKEVNYFTGLVAVMAVCVCAIVIGGYYGAVEPSHPGYLSTSAVVTNCIAVVVSLLPEGTPVALAMILTMIAKRMLVEKILVKKLTVLETLGSATLIASDKTGTLTQNRMTLKHLWIANDYKGAGAQSQGSPSPKEKLKKDSVKEKRNEFDEVEQQTSGCFGPKNIGKNLTEPSLNYLCQMMCLCNKTVFEAEEEDESGVPRHRRVNPKNVGPQKFIGNPTEGALLLAANEYLEVKELRAAAPIVKEIAFSSRTKYHLTIHGIKDKQLFQNTAYAIRGQDGNIPYGHVIYVKGAPEYILGMCTKIVLNGDEVSFNPHLVARVMKVNELMASHGERVLALAYRKLPAKQYPENFNFEDEDEDRWTSDLCFLGLAGIIDPPREGVADSIKECHTAQVRVMMVTGDQPMTAVAIAQSINIISHKHVKNYSDIERRVPLTIEGIAEETENKYVNKFKRIFKSQPKRTFRNESVVIAGNEIAQLSSKQWDYVLEHKEVVFARTTPQQKLQIVKESRKRGDVVAVTGDGVNDAPALKAADLGVAMGICGSDVSKEAANMILLDDNFVTIVKGIREGRLLFENLKKVICYLFPNGSFSEILPVLAAVFLGMPMPLSTFLMILICIGSDMIGSLGLIHEYPEADIMTRPPRNAKTDRLVTIRTILFAYFFVGIMESTIAFFMYFFTIYQEAHIWPNRVIFSYNGWGKDGFLTNSTTSAIYYGWQQAELNYKGQTAFFVSLVMTQLWNLLAVRTRYQSIFRQKFQKKVFYYLMGEVAVVLCAVYLPFINKYMYTRPMEYYHFLIPFAMGSVILMCDEIRKLLVRKYPKGILAKLAW